MHRDLTLGLVASILIHAGTFYGDRFIDFKTPLMLRPPAERIEIIDLPRFEPDDPERPMEEPDQLKPIFTRPAIIDLPQVLTKGAFAQQVQPPPPDPSQLNPGVLEIPGGSALANFRGEKVFDPSMLDQIPQGRYRFPPNYPFDMRRLGIEGEVLVDFLVDAEGNVQNASALKSSQREFEAAAVQAIAKWKFRPGRKNGQNVVTHMQVPIIFSLDQNRR